MSLAQTTHGWRFLSACREPERHQLALLRALLARHGDTVFGREHGLSPRMSVEDFRAAVPVRRHHELSDWIERSIRGEPRVLTAESPQWFARSSGTTGTAKMLPLTRDGVRAYQTVRDLWVRRTLELFPEVSRGALFAVSSSSDEESLSPQAAALRQSTMAWVPPRSELARLVTTAPPPPADLDPDGWGRHVLGHALRHDLSALVATSPSTLCALLDALAEWGGELCEQLSDDPSAAARAEALRAALASGARTARAFWPKLALLGCWTEGSSRLYAPWLAQLSGGVAVQDIGLVASEGYFAVPVERHGPAVLAVGVYVIELLSADGPSTEAAIWDDLAPGDQVRLVVTTPSGLWRYDTEDVVEVVGRLARTPAVAFVRRAGRVVSLAGEKVSEHQVVQAMEQARAQLDLAVVDFVCELRWPAGSAPRYLFRVELTGEPPPAERLATTIEQALVSLNVEYGSRRAQGRLAPAQIELAGAGMFRERHRGLLRAGAPEAEAKLGHLILRLPPAPHCPPVE